jgi:protoporphyrinogen/coproporphyrinogen III oxidase
MIAIIGAGISGLTTAYFLQKASVPYVLLEKSDRAGGYIQTQKQGNYRLELGPNSLLADAELMDFLAELDLENEILPANAVSKNRYIFKNGRYQTLPTHPLQLLFGNFFSWKTKKAILRERNNASQSTDNETLGNFFERRFSKEIVDYALDPFISGIYAGNAYELLVSRTFPQLLQMEKEYGSVLRGFMKQSTTARRKSLSFRGGMQSFPQAIADKLSHLQLGINILSLEKTADGFHIHTPSQTFNCQAVVLATDTLATAEILKKSYQSLAEKIRKVAYAPMAVVHTAVSRGQVNHSLNGFGGLNPAIEGQFSLGSIWSSSVFAERCPADEVLFTSFVGGMRSPDKVQLPEREIMQKIWEELKRNYGISTPEPVFQQVYKWERALPQYTLETAQTQDEAAEMEWENLFVCSNWKGGVSLSDCVKKGRNLALNLQNLIAEVKYYENLTKK